MRRPDLARVKNDYEPAALSVRGPYISGRRAAMRSNSHCPGTTYRSIPRYVWEHYDPCASTGGRFKAGNDLLQVPLFLQYLNLHLHGSNFHHSSLSPSQAGEKPL